MKKSYKNKLPKDLEVVGAGVRVEKGELIVDVEFKKKFDPKDGDFLLSATGLIFIFKKDLGDTFCERCAESYVGIERISGKIKENLFFVIDKFRYATEQEKSDFLARLEKECGKRWNPGTKELEDIRWRAKTRERYYFVTSACDVATYEESNLGCDNTYYNLGNYFRNVEAAQKVAEQIKDIFKNSKAE